jgi:hypothetical protein
MGQSFPLTNHQPVLRYSVHMGSSTKITRYSKLRLIQELHDREVKQVGPSNFKRKTFAKK